MALLGPRQVGKTTLALEIAETKPSIYLDLEAPEDLAKLTDPSFFLQQYEDRLVILDEIHRLPTLFQALRGIIDRGRRKGLATGRFLLLGSASMELLKQTGESLAGRIEYVDMTPFDILEIENNLQARTLLWVRGGFPDSYLAASDSDSMAWRKNIIRAYLERDIAQFGPRIPAETLDRFWKMLAHLQGDPLNASRLAAGLGVSGQTVMRYIDLLVDLLLVRRLQPYHANTGKRLIKSPKIYVRDSGLVHALLGITDFNQLLGHPVSGMSWEGFVIENLLTAGSNRAAASFFRTSGGAEINLILEFAGGKKWAIEIKSGLIPKVEKGFYLASADIKPEKSFVVYAGNDRYPLTEGIQAIGLKDLMRMIHDSI